VIVPYLMLAAATLTMMVLIASVRFRPRSQPKRIAVLVRIALQNCYAVHIS